ncbi:hypothetical protein CsSME_00005690 [Camellia sinensis var. sinensis]
MNFTEAKFQTVKLLMRPFCTLKQTLKPRNLAAMNNYTVGTLELASHVSCHVGVNRPKGVKLVATLITRGGYQPAARP